MSNINLLPWRDEYRQEKKREFFSILVLMSVAAGLVAFLWFNYANSQIDAQKQRNALLSAEIALLENQVQEIQLLRKRRQQLETRITIIQDLQFKRPLVVRYFDGFVRAVPEGLYFNKLDRKGDKFSLQGITESNNRVSTLMRNLDRSDWFEAPNLKTVIADTFDLSVDATTLSKEAGK
jgi:type IV pilus assembly protein PilN